MKTLTRNHCRIGTRKLYRDISTGTAAFINQKRECLWTYDKDGVTSEFMKGVTRGLWDGWIEGNYLRLMPGLCLEDRRNWLASFSCVPVLSLQFLTLIYENSFEGHPLCLLHAYFQLPSGGFKMNFWWTQAGYLKFIILSSILRLKVFCYIMNFKIMLDNVMF